MSTFQSTGAKNKHKSQLSQGGVDELNAIEVGLAACPGIRWVNLQLIMITVHSYGPIIFLSCLGQMPFYRQLSRVFEVRRILRYTVQNQSRWGPCAISQLKKMRNWCPNVQALFIHGAGTWFYVFGVMSIGKKLMSLSG